AAIIAPSAAMASAVARPMPAPAPVTSTALSCKTGILSSSTDIWLTRLRRRCGPRNGNSFVQSGGSAIFLPAGSAKMLTTKHRDGNADEARLGRFGPDAGWHFRNVRDGRFDGYSRSMGS